MINPISLVFSARPAPLPWRALLVLALYFVLVVPTCAPPRADRGVKTADQYWLESGLDSSELEILLSPANCFRDHRHFLGCVNALSAMAERYQLVLEKDGRLVRMSPEKIESRLTEKRELSEWESRFQTEEISPDFSFMAIWRELDSRHVAPEERAAVIASGINAYLSVTRDPHSYILPLAMYEEVLSRSDARAMHLGFTSKRVKGGAYVRKVFAGSPAAVAGLRRGDRILEVNGQEVTGLRPSQFSDMLRVRTGDRIRLRISRLEKGARVAKYVEILKTDAVFPNVMSKRLPGNRGAGLVTLHKFARGTCADVRREIVSLKEEGLQGLILDLRDNPGGQVEEAACVLNLFVEKGRLLFETRYLDQSKPSERYISEKAPEFRGPLSILINGGSASAAEIVAGSLKDMGRATLVGERSFGKGTFQDGRLWAPNPRIAIFETEGLYYFPSGWTSQIVGLEPDVRVSAAEDETLREEDLYYHPIRPSDLWLGPQGLAWMTESACPSENALLEEDPQIEKAWALMNCESGSAAHDRHGNL